MWTSILNGDIQLCVHTEILYEYAEILSEKTSKEIAHNIVEAMAGVELLFNLRFCTFNAKTVLSLQNYS